MDPRTGVSRHTFKHSGTQALSHPLPMLASIKADLSSPCPPFWASHRRYCRNLGRPRRQVCANAPALARMIGLSMRPRGPHSCVKLHLALYWHLQGSQAAQPSAWLQLDLQLHADRRPGRLAGQAGGQAGRQAGTQALRHSGTQAVSSLPTPCHHGRNVDLVL
jgi:hypothetical protein